MKIKLFILFLLFGVIISGGLWLKYFMGVKTGDVEETRQYVPAPASGYRMVVNTNDFKAGNKINIKEVEIAEKGFITVVKEVEGESKGIGRSDELQKGVSKNVNVQLSENITDGDVIVVSLVDSLGTVVLDVNGNAIEVVSPIGMTMGHYDNEY